MSVFLFGSGAGALPPWSFFDCTGATLRDPNSITSGTGVTFDAVTGVNSIPMVGGTARGSMDDAATFYVALPGNALLPGSNGNPRQVLDVEVSFSTPPTGLYGAVLGFAGTSTVGAGAGLQRGSSTWLAYAAEGFGSVQGASDASATVARGLVWIHGVSGARKFMCLSAARSSNALEQEDGTLADASIRLAATMVWRGSGAAVETLTPILKYRLINLE